MEQQQQILFDRKDLNMKFKQVCNRTKKVVLEREEEKEEIFTILLKSFKNENINLEIKKNLFFIIIFLKK